MLRQTSGLRALARAFALALVCASALAGGVAAAHGDDRDDDRGGGRDHPDHDRSCPDGREITLMNGRIYTMDKANRVVSTVTIRNGKFTSVGPDEGSFAPSGCRQVVNLQGRTVTPGLVDNHNHIVLLGLRPGYHSKAQTRSTTSGRSTGSASATPRTARSSRPSAASTRPNSPRSACRRWPS